MYQTNQGPSFPAHQFIFTGASAQTAADEAKSTFISETFKINTEAGCLAPAGAINRLVSPVVNTAGGLHSLR